MRKVWAIVAVALSALPAQASWTDHWVGRDGAYYAHRQIAGPFANTLIGDSIIEGFWWSYIGSCRMVNAGYGGINAENMLAHMPNINANSTPKYAIIMLGTNDALPFPFFGDPADFRTHILAIVDSLEARGATVLIASIPPIEPGKSASASRDQAAVNALNAEIVYRIAQPRGLKLINLNTPFMDMSTGLGKTGYTRDGIHPTGPSYVTLYYAFNAALQAEIARTGVGC